MVVHNCNYNLMKAMTKKLNAIVKYDIYVKDAQAAGHTVCATLWKKMQEEDRRHVQEMKQILEALVKEGRFT